MTDAEIIFALYQSGLIKDPKKLPAGRTLEHYIAQFQEIHGLKVDGEAGPVTQMVLDRPRICGVKDRLVLDATQKCRWDGTPRPLPLTWTVTGVLPGATMQKMVQIGQASWDQWGKVCGLQFRYTTDAGSADVVTDVGKIDPRGGVLAWSELPCGPDRQLKQMLDTSEVWDFALGTPTDGRISLLAVWTHENGHAKGLDHGGNGLMQAFYSDRILGPQPGYDFDESTLRYGKPFEPTTPTTPIPPTTPPGTPAPGKVRVSVNIGNAIYTGDVPKL